MRMRCTKTLKGEYRKGKFYRGIDGEVRTKGESVKIVADDGQEKWAKKSHFRIEE